VCFSFFSFLVKHAFFCEKKCRDIIMICGKSNWKLDLPLCKDWQDFFSVFGIDFFNGGGRDQKIKIFSVVIRLDF